MNDTKTSARRHLSPKSVYRAVLNSLSIASLLHTIKTLLRKSLNLVNPLTYLEIWISILNSAKLFIEKYFNIVSSGFSSSSQASDLYHAAEDIPRSQMLTRKLSQEFLEKLDLIDVKSLESFDTFSTMLPQENKSLQLALGDLQDGWKQLLSENVDLKLALAQLEIKIQRMEAAKAQPSFPSIREVSSWSPCFKQVSSLNTKNQHPLHSVAFKLSKSESSDEKTVAFLSLVGWNNLIQNFEFTLFTESQQSEIKPLKKWKSNVGKNEEEEVSGSYCVRFNNTEEVSFLGVSSSDGTAKVFGFESGELLQVYKSHQGEVNGLDFNSYDTLMATTCDDGLLRIFDVATTKILTSFTQSETLPTYGVKFSNANPNLIASTSFDVENSVKLFDMRVDKPVKSYEYHTRDVVGIDFSANGDYLVSSGDDCQGVVINLRANRIQKTFKAETELKRCFFLRENKISFGDSEGRIHIFSVDEETDVYSFGVHQNAVFDTQYIESGSGLVLGATASHDATCQIFSL
eukprot:snap_masked-scaffold_14-processed-gene-1.16-mRNA-1 protein AED:1.00 eAED:1.00 QI:0/-1/0/0/-1/1/1/0/516